MPSYKVTDPKTGKSLKMTGNTPPSSQTIQKAFGNTPRTLSGFGENVASSAGKFLGETGSAIANVFNPDMQKNTVANLGRLGAGVAQKLDPTTGNKIANPLINAGKVLATPRTALDTIQSGGQVGNYEPMANAVGAFYKDRYGGAENIKKTLYEDPVGAVGDVASVVAGGAGLVKGGATLTGKANLASKAGRVASVANQFDPLVAATSGIGKVAKPVFSKFSKLPDEIVTKGIGNPVKQANAEQKAGRSTASFIDEYDLYDRSPETAGQVRKNIGEQFDTTAMQSGKSIETGRIASSFDEKINSLKQGSGGVIADATAQEIAELERRKQMFLQSTNTNNKTAPSVISYVKNGKKVFTRLSPEELALLENEIKAIPEAKGGRQIHLDAMTPKLEKVGQEVSRDEFLKGHPQAEKVLGGESTPLKIGLDEATTFRRNVIDPDVPKSEFGLNPTDKGKAGGVKASRDIFRKESIKVAPELEKLGLDYGMAKELEAIFKASEARKNNRQMLNFTKLGSAGVGGLVSGIPGAITGYMLEQLVNSPYFIKHASKGLKSALKAKLPKGVKTFSKGIYNVGRAGRMTNDE